MNDRVFITECPRDAMQGIKEWIETNDKITYLNSLLECGFDTLDFGSFVSPKAIPQMQDTARVLEGLNESDTKLLAIIPNERGAEDAAKFERIDFLGYPFSISETFQVRNTNATIQESLKRVEAIANICHKENKELVLYLSMGFGNPYGDAWSPDLIVTWAERLTQLFEVSRLSLSDTIGVATPALIQQVFSTILSESKSIQISAHLHTLPENAAILTEAAYTAGCRYFEGAIKGFGGCPMAKDELTGNMPTERMLDWFKVKNIETGVDPKKFTESFVTSSKIFH
ncbi:hydroxymethylglutaryl-CoA lyase [Fluviicola taffensis]|uniref:Hydroxymethylglutaryl-CoA lyase n=1 Tax=Fluviicola taffensis (strain DSM 16823 / NCIMB 13979 / RW262) TaxID=755732 RepID=F2IBP4_FLUTR|nr:hydroxymethylglutaryl-CoA lyase [Fluviicola taffensis]AEA45370.1 Hydroxymethylglutaryl-CoA lyase [Fluviicola taffensis DSM 16823]